MYKSNLTETTLKEIAEGVEFYICIDNAILLKFRKLRYNKAKCLDTEQTTHLADHQTIYLK